MTTIEDPSLDRWWPAQPLALVIGAGGMGKAAARRLGQTHELLLADRDAERLETVGKILREDGVNVHTALCDVTNAASVKALAETAARIGPLRTLAHVAGLSPSMADWRTILSVNLLGPVLIANAMLPLTRPGSAAIFISSLAAHLMPADPAVLKVLEAPLSPGWLDALASALGAEPTTTQAYALSKSALMRMCQQRAGAWGQRRARIVSLSPGLIATPMGRMEFQNPNKHVLYKRTPLERQGSMDEIVDALEFLASDRASFISGTDLLVDGGVAAAVRFPC